MSVDKALWQQAKALGLSKGLSQNFLVDRDVIAAIAQAVVQDTPPTLPVVEIGAGAGFLTQALLETSHPVTAIEVDPKMADVLTRQFGGNPAFRLVPQNVLQVDLAALVGERGVLVGNLPYHLTGPILFQILGELDQAEYPLRQRLVYAVVMVQYEVGERLLARPGDKAYSQLTLQAQFWFEATPVLNVPKTAFCPPPEVDSMVVRLTPRPAPPIPVNDLGQFSRLVKQAFQHRRKTLLNNLKIAGWGDLPHLQAVLAQAEIPLDARPQTVSMAQFGRLLDVLTV